MPYLLDAIEKNELPRWIRGEGEYSKKYHKEEYVVAPTNWDYIIKNEYYPLFLERPDLRLDILFEENIDKMIDGDCFDIYCVLMILFDQFYNEHSNNAPFTIDKDKVLNKLHVTILRKKHELHNCRKGGGSRMKEGMWGEVNRINKIWNREWGISFL